MVNPDLYCTDSGPDYRCTTYDPQAYFEVTFNGIDHICEARTSSRAHRCQRWIGGPPPISIIGADLYCSGDGPGNMCTVYNPDEYFEVDSQGRRHLCDKQFTMSQYKCELFNGTSIPMFGYEPALYCSGSESSVNCSTSWYPDELDRYNFTTISGTTYLCEAAYGAGLGDLDCHRYNGGDPNSATAGLPDQYCSPSGSVLDCDPGDYPSVWEGLRVVTIDYSQFICKSTFQGEECHRWYGGGSPSSATFGIPDYYCNRTGCDPNRYP
jgi:hypothetical protein